MGNRIASHKERGHTEQVYPAVRARSWTFSGSSTSPARKPVKLGVTHNWMGPQKGKVSDDKYAGEDIESSPIVKVNRTTPQNDRRNKSGSSRTISQAGMRNISNNESSPCKRGSQLMREKSMSVSELDSLLSEGSLSRLEKTRQTMKCWGEHGESSYLYDHTTDIPVQPHTKPDQRQNSVSTFVVPNRRQGLRSGEIEECEVKTEHSVGTRQIILSEAEVHVTGQQAYLAGLAADRRNRPREQDVFMYNYPSEPELTSPTGRSHEGQPSWQRCWSLSNMKEPSSEQCMYMAGYRYPRYDSQTDYGWEDRSRHSWSPFHEVSLSHLSDRTYSASVTELGPQRNRSQVRMGASSVRLQRRQPEDLNSSQITSSQEDVFRERSNSVPAHCGNIMIDHQMASVHARWIRDNNNIYDCFAHSAPNSPLKANDFSRSDIPAGQVASRVRAFSDLQNSSSTYLDSPVHAQSERLTYQHPDQVNTRYPLRSPRNGNLLGSSRQMPTIEEHSHPRARSHSVSCLHPAQYPPLHQPGAYYRPLPPRHVIKGKLCLPVMPSLHCQYFQALYLLI